MSSSYILRKGHASLGDLTNGYAAQGLGIGNVYRVCASGEAYYNDFVADHGGTYRDGSEVVHTTIASALAATVECRNDYVIVQPKNADYDITTALAMDKKAVHLICPAGLGYPVGAPNSCRIEQTGAYQIITITDAAVEIAGFYFKNYATKGGIIFGAGSYSSNIHHNRFAMVVSGSTNEPFIGPLIASTGVDYGAYSTVHHNEIVSTTGASATIASLIRAESPATSVTVSYNYLGMGDTNNTATVGIMNQSVKGITSYNDFYAFQTANGAGVFTHCVHINAAGVAYGNKGNVADGILMAGGTDNLSFIENYNSSGDGGALDDQQ